MILGLSLLSLKECIMTGGEEETASPSNMTCIPFLQVITHQGQRNHRTLGDHSPDLGSQTCLGQTAAHLVRSISLDW